MDRPPLDPVPPSVNKAPPNPPAPAGSTPGTGASQLLGHVASSPVFATSRPLPPLIPGRISKSKSTVVQNPATTKPEVQVEKPPTGLSGDKPPAVAPNPAVIVPELLSPWTECAMAPAAESTRINRNSQPEEEAERHQAYSSEVDLASSVRVNLDSASQSGSYSASYPFLSPPDKPGFLGRIASYRVSEMIGEGGMGYVFLAEDKYLRRPVALKVMKPDVAKRKRCWGWFLDEARATAALQSDRMATIYQIGEQRGTLFLAMELLHGESVEARLKRGALPLAMSLWILREASLGLAQVHRVGIFHRDIKPGNLWLGVPRDPERKSADIIRTYGDEKQWRTFSDEEYTQVKILDFGLALLTEGATGRLKKGEAMGTPPYMSPEQANGQPGDARSDIFSLGVVMYRLLADRLPFQGSNLLELITSLSQTPPPISEYNPHVPPPLVDVTQRMIALDPDKRPQSAEEVAQIVHGAEQTLAALRAMPQAGNHRNSFWRRVVGGPAKQI
jgi:serine/threonine protein kinase